MRILLIHSGADLYGASRSLLRLSRGLVAAGHTVHVLLPFDGPLRGALQQAGAQAEVRPELPLITRQRFTSVAGLLGFARDARRCAIALRGVLDAFRPDVVHTNNTTVLAAYAGELRRRGIPHLWHVRESFAEFRLLWPLLRRYILTHADRVLCVSAAVAAQFGGHPAVEVLHNGFPRAEFARVTAADAQVFRRAHGLEGRTCVGVAGRLKLKRKGQETFLRAASALRARFPDARFLLIGSPFPGNEAHETALRQLAGELGLGDAAVFTGDAPDHLAALAALDVVVLSSGLPEPFGGVVVEAMALGRPVVGTNIGGTPEQIEDGVTGLLVPPNEPEALAAAIGRLLDNPAQAARMGEAGRARFLARFEFDPFFARLLARYQTLADRRGAPR
jgi:glycosyltransferase involved in cell wall biosynthesis